MRWRGSVDVLGIYSRMNVVSISFLFGQILCLSLQMIYISIIQNNDIQQINERKQQEEVIIALDVKDAMRARTGAEHARDSYRKRGREKCKRYTEFS